MWPALNYVTLALLAWPTVAGAQPQVSCSNPIGVVVSIEGNVSIKRAGLSQWQHLSFGDTLCPEDRIYVDERSRAALTLDSFGVLRLDQNSVVQLPAAAPTEARSLFEMIGGALHFFSNDPNSSMSALRS